MKKEDIERRIKSALDLKSDPDSEMVINTRSFVVGEAIALVAQAEAEAYEKAESAVCNCSTFSTTGEHLAFCAAQKITGLKRSRMKELASS